MDNRPLTPDFRQPKVKDSLEITERFLLTILFPALNSHIVIAQ